MPIRLLLSAFFMCWVSAFHAQDVFFQYFDGADTLGTNSIIIELEDDSTNIWQIGPPQKTLFDAASTQPNGIVTDTLEFYPVNDTSSFSFEIPNEITWSIFAVQWMQKLDYDEGDGGVVYFSTDSGGTWHNALTDPTIYNYFGFDEVNVDTLFNGEIGFTGQDNEWKNIWLCFDESWVYYAQAALQIKFTSYSDSTTAGVIGQHEGWLVDNIINNSTLIHTVQETEMPEYISLSPNPTDGIVQIETRKEQEYHIIESMELINASGLVVQRFGPSPTKYRIDIGQHPPGVYFLKVKTNLATETMRVVLN